MTIEFVVSDGLGYLEAKRKMLDTIDQMRLERIKKINRLLSDAEKEGGDLDKALRSRKLSFAEKEQTKQKIITNLNLLLKEEEYENLEKFDKIFKGMTSSELLDYVSSRDLTDSEFEIDIREDSGKKRISNIEIQLIFCRCSDILNSNILSKPLMDQLSPKAQSGLEAIRKVLFGNVVNQKDAQIKESLVSCLISCIIHENLKSTIVEIMYSGVPNEFPEQPRVKH